MRLILRDRLRLCFNQRMDSRIRAIELKHAMLTFPSWVISLILKIKSSWISSHKISWKNVVQNLAKAIESNTCSAFSKKVTTHPAQSLKWSFLHFQPMMNWPPPSSSQTSPTSSTSTLTKFSSRFCPDLILIEALTLDRHLQKI